MTLRPNHRQGMPLVFLGVILSSWTAARIVTWQGIDAAAEPAPGHAQRIAAVRAVPAAATRARPTLLPTAVAALSPALRDAGTWPRSGRGAALPPRIDRSDPGAVVRIASRQASPAPATAAAVPVPAISGPAQPSPTARPRGQSRWSGDAWLLLRWGDAGPLGAGVAAPAYGGSQAGAVVRYRLAPGSAHRPALYLRASGAAIAGGEREAAFGLSARPLRRLPVAALAEARVTRSAGTTRIRPALALVSELPPLPLAAGVSAEAYGQAGWVGGRGATGFVDGQIRATRTLARRQGARLALGGGVWGGAQKGAARLDLGPTAVIAVPVGAGSARLAADWRFRLSGNAAPGSGPVVTISAGF